MNLKLCYPTKKPSSSSTHLRANQRPGLGSFLMFMGYPSTSKVQRPDAEKIEAIIETHKKWTLSLRAERVIVGPPLPYLRGPPLIEFRGRKCEQVDTWESSLAQDALSIFGSIGIFRCEWKFGSGSGLSLVSEYATRGLCVGFVYMVWVLWNVCDCVTYWILCLLMDIQIN